ncbi:hypothetical protein M427DRAFT_310714 [Gonapodya prolifera JEL478]|uniref:RNA polymerase II elongation factor ELL N-terminal domain-containing protein n=1 Tax=Gonapodya prolifera (strain JEL478) TaxID=1344416 RepID=A0A139AWG8_GONPJ|nr:hypothetical protein M427DRAFT_310714 [Gonapodya prolifera JEL478]|eukprot:KXS21068.1 hypothetical protein M427DRAFT_310714 [Gonapodya prolifera JEL478]
MLDEKDKARQLINGSTTNFKAKKKHRDQVTASGASEPSSHSTPDTWDSPTATSSGLNKPSQSSSRASPATSGTSTPSMLWYTSDLRERLIQILAVKPLSFEDLARAVHLPKDRLTQVLPELAILSHSKYELLPIHYKELRIYDWPKYDARERESVLSRARVAFESLRLPSNATEWGKLVEPPKAAHTLERVRTPAPDPSLSQKHGHQRSSSQPPQSRDDSKAHRLSADEDGGTASDGGRIRKGNGSVGKTKSSGSKKVLSKEVRKKTAETNSKRTLQEIPNHSVSSMGAGSRRLDAPNSEGEQPTSASEPQSKPPISPQNGHTESSREAQRTPSSGGEKRKRSGGEGSLNVSSESSSDQEMDDVPSTVFPIRTMEDFTRASNDFRRLHERYQKVRRNIEQTQSSYRSRRLELVTVLVGQDDAGLSPEMRMALDRKLARELTEIVPKMRLWFERHERLHETLLQLKLAMEEVVALEDQYNIMDTGE